MKNFDEILQGSAPVLIDFYASWCQPCTMMSPILKEVKQELKDRVTILKVDVDKNPKLASTYQVRGVPTFILFQKGKLLWRQSGMLQKSELISILKNYTESNERIRI